MHQNVPSDWWNDNGRVWARLYPVFGVPVSGHSDMWSELQNVSLLLPRTSISLVSMRGANFEELSVRAVSNEVGSVILHPVVSKLKIEESGFLIIHCGVTTDEGEPRAIEKLEQTSAWLRLFVGTSVTSHKFFDTELHNDSSHSFSSNSIRVEGAYRWIGLPKDNSSSMHELAAKFRPSDHSLQSPIRQALRHISKSMETQVANDQFLSCWTALEIIHGRRMRHKIHKMYRNIPSRNIDLDIGWPGISKIRDAIIHEGKLVNSPKFGQLIKYLHMILVDSIRYRMNLPPHGFAFSERKRLGLDLRLIGLSRFSPIIEEESEYELKFD